MRYIYRQLRDMIIDLSCSWSFLILLKRVYIIGMVRFMVFNATFNTISVISWRQFYWWRKTEYPEKTTDLSKVTDRENHRPVESHWQRKPPTCRKSLTEKSTDLSKVIDRENHRPVESHWQTLSHNVVLSKPRHERGSNSQL